MTNCGNWVEYYCLNIAILAKENEAWAQMLSSRMCDRIGCKFCPLHPNRIRLIGIPFPATEVKKK